MLVCAHTNAQEEKIYNYIYLETPEDEISQNLLVLAHSVAGLIQHSSKIPGTWERINLVFILSENQILAGSMQIAVQARR